MDWSLFWVIIAQLLLVCVILGLPIAVVIHLWTSAARQTFSRKGTKIQ